MAHLALATLSHVRFQVEESNRKIHQNCKCIDPSPPTNHYREPLTKAQSFLHHGIMQQMDFPEFFIGKQ